jgi:opacity protein-like surface antigen
MKKLLFLLFLMLPFTASAQWRVGANVGASFNHPTIDRQYMTDLQYKDRWGITTGLMGQYDFNEWLGVRAELNLTQKNYRQTRTVIQGQDYKFLNNYLLMPVMASFGFGSEKIRGFCNVGVYGGYWLNASRKGEDYNSFTKDYFTFSESMDFDKYQDQRWDCGFVGGLGLEYRFCNRWGAQVEARYYYSTTSFRKEMPHLNDKRYHSTFGLQAGVMYFF